MKTKKWMNWGEIYGRGIYGKNKKNSKSLDNFIAFGSRKSVFWPITAAVITLSITGIPTLFQFKTNLNNLVAVGFIMIWLFQIIYTWMYFDKKRRRKKENEIKRALMGKRK